LDDLKPPPANALPFIRPAEYYDSPPSLPRLVPRGVSFGCGAAALAFLLLTGVVAGGSGKFLAWIFGKLQSEIDGQFTKEVTADQRKAFDDSMNALRTKMRAMKVDGDALQRLTKAISEASADDRITPEEAKRLTEAAQQARGK